MPGEKKCKHCKQSFPNNNRYFKRASCLSCHALFDVSLDNARSRAKEQERDFDLDKDWLNNQFAKQNHQCWWTGQNFDLSRPLIPHVQNPNGLTIDRLVNEEGYTKQNSVLCVSWFNKFKSTYSIPELNYLLMGCVSAYTKIQQMFVSSSTTPFHEQRHQYEQQFTLPLTQEEIDKINKDLDAGHYDPLG